MSVRNTSSLDIQDVVLSFDLVRLAAEVESHGRERRDRVTLDCVLSVPGLLGVDLLVDELSNVRREGNERSSCHRSQRRISIAPSKETNRDQGDSPVSIAAPVFSNSKVSFPNLTFSNSTSQYPFLLTGT